MEIYANENEISPGSARHPARLHPRGDLHRARPRTPREPVDCAHHAGGRGEEQLRAGGGFAGARLGDEGVARQEREVGQGDEGHFELRSIAGLPGQNMGWEWDGAND